MNLKAKEFKQKNNDEFEGKTICLDCEFSSMHRSLGWLCSRNVPESLYFVIGTKIEDFQPCCSKNKTGECEDFSHADFEKRFDSYIQKSSERLRKEIDDIFEPLRVPVPTRTCLEDEFIKLMSKATATFYPKPTAAGLFVFPVDQEDEIDIDIIRGSK